MAIFSIFNIICNHTMAEFKNMLFTHYYDSLACSMRDHDASSVWIKDRILFIDEDGRRTLAYDEGKLRQEGDFLISIDENRLHLCFSQDEEVWVPEGVRSIATGAFLSELCPNVRHIILPQTVDGISRGAICCATLEQMTINNKYVYISDESFGQISDELAVHMKDQFTYIVKTGCDGPEIMCHMPSSDYGNYVYAKENDLPF